MPAMKNYKQLKRRSCVPHADTQSPRPHVDQGYPHYHQDRQSSAPPAESDASNVQKAAAGRSRFPTLLDRPAQADTPHSFPIDRDARCIVQRVAVVLRAHGSHVRAPRRCTHRAVHRGAIPLAAIVGLRRAGRCVRAEAPKSSPDNAGSLRDDSGIVPKDRLPSHTGREALPFCHSCGFDLSH